MLSTNTNIQSLISQNIFANTSKSLNETMERLSTGNRINSSKDDAAGFAISNRMTKLMVTVLRSGMHLMVSHSCKLQNLV